MYPIVGFNLKQRKSLLYKCCLNKKQLHETLDKALDAGSLVISIRVVEESGSINLEPKGKE